MPSRRKSQRIAMKRSFSTFVNTPSTPVEIVDSDDPSSSSSGFTTPTEGAQITETVDPRLSAKKSSRSRKRTKLSYRYMCKQNSFPLDDTPRKTPEQESSDRNVTHDARSGFTTPTKGAQITETAGPQMSAPKKWTSEEEASLKAGVAKHGPGNWSTILEDPEFGSVLRLCSSVDLKDKWRNLHSRSSGCQRARPAKSKKQPIHMHPPTTLAETLQNGSSCFDHHCISLNQANVTSAGTTTNNQQDWPFIKRSPIWAAVESLGLHLTPPQKPHFSSLERMKEDCREGLAIGLMVTYGNLVQRLSDFHPNDPVDIINSSLETLCHLETHGFDVGSIRGRLNNMLSLKSKMCQHDDKRKELEKVLENRNLEKSLVDKEMEELQEKMVQMAAMQKVKEEEIVRLQSNLHLVSNQINDFELAF